MATIRDVAHRAGVSVATVSHVINESRFVAEDTQKRVQEAIEELEYRRDGVARSLRRNRTDTIGVVIADIGNPFFADLMKGIEATLQSQPTKVNAILCNTAEDPEKERHYLDLLLDRRVDGLILAPVGGNRSYLAGLAARNLPMVFVDRELPEVAVDTVLVDNAAASEKLVRHLIANGHQRLGMMRATLNVSSIAERVAGYHRALAAAGLEPIPDYEIDSASTQEAAHEVGSRLLDMRPRPDAIFCTNNFMILGLMRAIHDRGLACPGDIATAGFDDFPWAESFRPGITAVTQPAWEMGTVAASMLLNRIGRDSFKEPERRILTTSLAIRETSSRRS